MHIINLGGKASIMHTINIGGKTCIMHTINLGGKAYIMRTINLGRKAFIMHTIYLRWNTYIMHTISLGGKAYIMQFEYKTTLQKQPFADVFQNVFSYKFLCRILFLINLQTWPAASLLKRDSNTGVFMWILRNF